MSDHSWRNGPLAYALRIAFHPGMVVFVLMAALMLSGCATTRPVVPDQLLTCIPQPPAPSTGTQRDVGLYVVDLAAAGDDCRTKLGSVRKLMEPN